MSRAFIKEDLEQPELEKPAAFRAFRMVRDADGVKLAEIT
jgi:hypothetical protein